MSKMFIPPLADRSKAEALVKRVKSSIFDAIVDRLGYFGLSLILGFFIFFAIVSALPDLPRTAIPIIFFVELISLPICSFFLLRKLKSRYYRELEAIYAELFFEGFNEDQIVRLVSSTMLYILLPTRPSDSQKRQITLYKDKLWRLDIDNSVGD